MRFSSLLVTLVGGVFFAAAVPAREPEMEGPRQLSAREVADLEARIYNAYVFSSFFVPVPVMVQLFSPPNHQLTSDSTGSLEKRAFWSFIGWTGRDCTGGLAFAYTGQNTGGCTNTGTQAPSISYQNTWPVTPIAYSDTGCRNRASQTHVKDLGTNYWCMNGNVRSFQATRVLDE